MPVRIKTQVTTTEKTSPPGLEYVKRNFEFRRGISPYVCSTGQDFKVSA